VAGVDLSAGTLHVVVGRREDARLRIVGKGESPLPESAMNGGLVADRLAATDALREAFAAAEHVQHADRVAVALDSDDIRTYHNLTAFEREDSSAPVASGEESRAVREASADAVGRAAAATEEDAALRGVPTAQLHEDVAALALDGRGLRSLAGHRGRLVEVWTDVTMAPLVLTGAATATLEAARRRGTVVSGAYALARLLAGSGITDAGVVRLGADATSLGVLREGRVVATRVFALGRSALAARVGKADDDARVWADCVVASLRGLDGTPPGRWIFVGVPETLLALPRALSDVVGEIRGDAVDIAPLSVGAATRVYSDVPLRSDDLVAAGAAALAAGVYET
jgi:cell division ATPase FtsA